MFDTQNFTPYQKSVRELSDRLVQAQRLIRVLDSIKWGPEVKEAFFKTKCKELPLVNKDYYQKYPLPFDPAAKKEEFYTLERDIKRFLGQMSPVGNIMQRMCREYREVIRMLEARGSSEFSKISQELYGSADDAFYAGAPRLSDLAVTVSATLAQLKKNHLQTPIDEKRYDSEQAVTLLSERLANYFGDNTVRVQLSDGIVADAAAGADLIKIRKGALFSERDLRVYEVHEAWVHVATTLNGQLQPYCTFLSKGPPSSTITQEGLGVIMEIFTFSSYPDRVQRLIDRITATSMVEQGANFIEVYNFFRETQGISEDESYASAVRVFRGSTPDGGPFTKGLVYSKGFIMIYNYVRLAIQRGLAARIPLLFVGKTTLEDMRVLEDLVAEGLVMPPKYVPPQFTDIAGLSAWMSYSVFLNRLNLERVAADYKDILQA
jgi:uncharacterized protein (TIGR02421 family)